MGGYLDEKLDSKYTNIGFVVYEGKYTATNFKKIDSFNLQQAYKGTLEHWLNSADEPLFIMDLRKVRADKSDESQWMKDRLLSRITGVLHFEEEFAPFDIDDYDLLIFIKNVEASELLF